MIVSEKICECCNQQRGYIYTGPVYAVEEYRDCICPWCITNGSAVAKFDAQFTDSPDEDLDQIIIEEIVNKTVGFTGWQQEHWCACCNDGAAFLGLMGKQALIEHGEQAIAAIQDSTGLEGEDWEVFLRFSIKNMIQRRIYFSVYIVMRLSVIPITLRVSCHSLQID